MQVGVADTNIVDILEIGITNKGQIDFNVDLRGISQIIW